jgi:hypothetical protein
VSATQVLHRFGLWVLLRLLVVLTVFTTLALLRLPLLWLTSALTWGMHHTDRLMTPPTSPRDRNPNGGFPMPDSNTARSRPPAWTGPTTPESTPDTPHQTEHHTPTAAPPARSRPHRIASWIGWHTLELSTLTGSLTLAMWITGWFTIPAALITILWSAHEIRVARRQRAMTGRR